MHFSPLSPKISVFNLAIFCLSTSNLLWFMDLTFQVPIQYCSLLHKFCFHHQTYPQLSVVSALAQPHHSVWSYYSLPSALPQWHIRHLLTWGAHLLVSYLFVFSYCPWGSPGKNTGVSCHFLLQWTTFCHNCSLWPSWLALHGMSHSFIELHEPFHHNKAVMHEGVLY